MKRRITLVIFLVLLCGCAADKPSEPSVEIEKAAREYYAKQNKQVRGISLKPSNTGDAYLVTTELEGESKTDWLVAQKYHSGDKVYWKVSPPAGRSELEILGITANTSR